MKFVFRAKKGLEDIIENTIEAANQDAAVAKIIEQGLVPVLVEEEQKYLARESSKKRAAPPQISFMERVTKNDIFTFTKKLRVLLKSQVPILSSLYILEDQITNRKFKELIHRITEAVKEGADFSESLARFPQHFPPLYVSIIKAGEASGKIDYSLEQITKYLYDERQITQKVRSSLAYPVLMITVGIATVIFVITFIIPKLEVLFEDMVDTLPFVTKVLLEVSLFFSSYWPFLLTFFVMFVTFLFFTRGSQWQAGVARAIKGRTPVVKNIIYNQSLCRFARALSILISSGIPVLESIRITTPLVEDRAAQGQLEAAYKQILAGSGLEESMRDNCRFLPDIFIKMVAIGEASGRLDEILFELADSYADEVDTATKIVTSLIEPMAILIVGSILGFIVIAILLPIFEMSFMIH
ncbi:MAG: type II secretion system F family protein [Candidatus Omnitrophica bacterium]|nr:type II secretion system F family protein [Candidatus Omnitrophota bacterium]